MTMQRSSPMALFLIVVVGALLLLSLLAAFLDQAPTAAQPETPATKARAAENAVETELDEFKAAVDSGNREEAEAALAKAEAELTKVQQLARDVADDNTQLAKVGASLQAISLDLGWARRVFRGRFGD